MSETIGIFGGGFMTLLVAFAAGFLILLARVDDSRDKVSLKLDAISAQIGEVKTDMAVMKATAPPKKP